MTRSSIVYKGLHETCWQDYRIHRRDLCTNFDEVYRALTLLRVCNPTTCVFKINGYSSGGEKRKAVACVPECKYYAMVGKR